MRIGVLLLILIFSCPLYPAEGPEKSAVPTPVVVAPVAGPAAGSVTSPAVGAVPQASAPSATPLFSDAEWQRAQGGAAQPQAGSNEVVAKAGLGLLLSLVAIAVIAGVLAIIMRKMGMKRVLPGRGRHLTVIETVPLGFKRSVSLLRIGDHVLVVGQGEHDLSHLATLPASILDEPTAKKVEKVEPVIDAPGVDASVVTQSSPPAAGFRAVLDALAGRRL
jgi:flagellar biogenesis protein FliO